MPLSLRAAARESGVAKTTLLRAIKSGRLSAQRDDQGGWSIDPSELFRAYPPTPSSGPADRRAPESEPRSTVHDAAPAEPGADRTDRERQSAYLATLEEKVR